MLQQPLGVVAGVHQQLGLLGRQRADRLLQQQVQRQPHAGQRRLEFVADGGHQVALDLVQQAEARHVAEHHRRPQRVAVGVADRQNLRQVGAVLAVEPEADGLVERLREERLLLLQGVGQRAAQRLRRLPRLRGGRRLSVARLRSRTAAADAEDAAGGRVGHLHLAAGVHHQYRIGKGVEDGLAGALRAQQPGGVRLAVVAELADHVVEGAGGLADLVVGRGHDLVEVAGADGLGRRRQFAQRPQDGAKRGPRQQPGQ